MSFLGFVWSHGALWLAAALVLAIAELIAPGFFMIFLAAGAALTGFALLAIPGLPVLVQALLFAVFTAAAVGLGRRWYHQGEVPTEDPQLNDRTSRLIGTTAEVCDAIAAGEGRVKVGDGAWKARGPDAAAGALVRIVGATGSVLLIEPL